MSLPDGLLNPEWEELCGQCGAIITKGRILCGECAKDLEDVYADEKISEGRY